MHFHVKLNLVAFIELSKGFFHIIQMLEDFYVSTFTNENVHFIVSYRVMIWQVCQHHCFSWTPQRPYSLILQMCQNRQSRQFKRSVPSTSKKRIRIERKVCLDTFAQFIFSVHCPNLNECVEIHVRGRRLHCWCISERRFFIVLCNMHVSKFAVVKSWCVH